MTDPIVTTPRRALPPVLETPAAPPEPGGRLAPIGNGRPRVAVGIVVALALATLAIHVVTNLVTPYGVHRDELLYMAMGRHLRVWRMDFPPMIALLAELARGTFGDSLAAIRLPSALASATMVALAALTARALGGFRTAQALAGLAVLTSPLFLRAGNLFQPVVFDQLWWTVGLYALVRMAHDVLPRGEGIRHRAWADGRSHQTPAHGATRHPRASRRLHPPVTLATLLDRPVARWWLLLGAAVGLGLLTKFSILFFAAGAFVGLLLSPLRRTLLGTGPWLALAVALAFGAPSIAGQIALDWPVVGQMQELRTLQLDRVGPLEFLGGQLFIGPAILLAPLGLLLLLTARETPGLRTVAWTCIAAFVLLLATHGKPYYAAPIYPTLLAAGAVAFERLTHPIASRRGRRTARLAAAATLVVFGLVALPLGLPILAPERMTRYTAALGLDGAANTTNRGVRIDLPQDYADMLGWPQQVVAVARAYDAIPAELRGEAVIIARNYGQAGAIDFYGPRLGLPGVVSAAGSYWFFGPGSLPGRVVVAIGIPADTLRQFFRRVTPLGNVAHEQLPWVVPEEREVSIVIGEDPVRSLQEIWPSLRPE